MSSADMLEDSFPHATPSGYTLGCRGSHCRGIEDFGWSCTYAMQQYRGDFQWRKWIEARKTPAEIAELRKSRGDVQAHVAPANPELRVAPTVTVASSRESTYERPKPRPVPNPAASVRPVAAGRWRVERKAPGAWRVLRVGDKRGRVFASHPEAFAFAVQEASGAREKPAQSRKKPGARAYTRLTAEQLAQAVEMRRVGKSFTEIAQAIGAKPGTLGMAVRKALKEERGAEVA